MSQKKDTVLVIDDDVHILGMLQRILELEGFRVLTAGGGSAGLQVFARENPSVVLLDIMMPEMDGYDVCKRIRQSSKVPIIMVSAKGRPEEKAHALNNGADDYLTKPFSAKELATRIRTVLRRVSV